MKKLRSLSLLKRLAIAGLMPISLTACTFNSQSLSGSYVGDSYMMGFHDGRHSGLKNAGDASESTIKDVTRFAEDAGYRDGWLAGEKEGQRIEREFRASREIAGKARSRKESDKTQSDKTADPAPIPEMQPLKLKF